METFGEWQDYFDYFEVFIAQQLAKPDEPETDQPIVHADIGYGVTDASN